MAKALSASVRQGLELRPDLDALAALSPDREALWARLDGASFLTQDEKRAAAGYGPVSVAGGDGAKSIPITTRRQVHVRAGWWHRPRPTKRRPRHFLPLLPQVSLPEDAANKGGIPKAVYNWTVRQFVSQYCKGSINTELPKQFENVTNGEMLNLAKGGDAAARTCSKLLNQGHFGSNERMP